MARDITGDIGNLYAPSTGCVVPMYSFERPAFQFWQGVFDGLIDKGLSEAEAFEWLQSKDARHMLDGPTGEWLRGIGRAAATQLGRKL